MTLPPRKTILAAFTTVILLVGGLLTLLWLLVDDGSAPVAVHLELVRIALTVLLGTGGMFGLWLAWRRQRSTEVALQQKERDQADVARAYDLQREIAEATQRDAEARRVTDLYTKAVEQLGSDKAPVRLGGLYALERLAQDHAEQRRTIVNVLCAYLRMPYDCPGDTPTGDATSDAVRHYRELVQEREVRVAAQRIIAYHLAPGSPDEPNEDHWPTVELDLTGVTLIGFRLIHCTLHNARFDDAVFIGVTTFRGTVFSGFSSFTRARFRGITRFDGATFRGEAFLSRTVFDGHTRFAYTTFARTPWFDEARFTKGVPEGLEDLVPDPAEH